MILYVLTLLRIICYFFFFLKGETKVDFKSGGEAAGGEAGKKTEFYFFIFFFFDVDLVERC